MLRKVFAIFISALLISTFSIPGLAQETDRKADSLYADIIQPCWEEITEYRNNFDISSTGKATIAVVLYAYEVDTIKVEAYLQQYKNGIWTTIKSWSNTSNNFYCGIGESWYVMSGHDYRLYSVGTVYENGVPIEQTTYTSDSYWY